MILIRHFISRKCSYVFIKQIMNLIFNVLIVDLKYQYFTWCLVFKMRDKNIIILKMQNNGRIIALVSC